MNYAYMEVALQEIPNEISLCIGITGCQLHCKGCHSKELWDENYGSPLTEEVYKDTLYKYKNKCSCICFMGGDQYPEEFAKFRDMAIEEGYCVALYTGQNWVDWNIMENLTYLKTGPYIESLGGLDSPTTNQRMYYRHNGELLDITKEFHR